MAPNMWFFFVIAGWLMAAFSGHSFPTPPGQLNTSRAESPPSEPGQRLGVRLVNGSSRCSGTVEVLLRAAWEPVCGEMWDSQAAEAVCRALGCGGAQGDYLPIRPPRQPPPWPTVGNSSWARNDTRAVVPAIRCRGTEWQLCEVLDHTCSSDGKAAQVTCAENRAVRLVDGGGRCAGRVEMLERQEWGSVCDDTWDLEDAHVVCRQMGCGWAVQALPGLHFVHGQGPIHRDQVNCSGAETYLWDCPGLPGTGFCGHKEDAGVVCSEHQSWRLTGGTDRCQGQVEVYFRGVWSTVCDSVWYSDEAEVLCRTLGCGTVNRVIKGLPHSLAGRMYYSCTGSEPTLSECFWRFNNSNLCRQSQAANVICSGSHNLSSADVPTSLQPVTVESSVTVKVEGKESWEVILLISCIILGILLLGSLISIVFLLIKVKGKYALPVMVNHQHPSAPTPTGTNSYQEAPIIIPKEEVPKFPTQIQMPAPQDSDSSSDSEYEHYDFSTQPPVALTTFYNSQRYRVTEEEVHRNRFQMPPLEEDPPSLAFPHHPGPGSDSSTSSGEDYCNSPTSKPPPWTPPVFSSERSPLLQQPPNLELAGSQPILSAGPSADDSSSTSSGEWYQNFQPLPPPPPPEFPSVEQLECPGPPSPQPASSDSDDYDDIGAT